MGKDTRGSKNKVKCFCQENQEVCAAAIIFLVILILITVLDVSVKNKEGFVGNLLGEGHGFLADILLFGVVLVLYNKLLERKRNNKRWQEEIEDYRHWAQPEAAQRIVGLVKRLSKSGTTNIDLSYTFLENAHLALTDLREAVLRFADLKGANLVMTNLIEANLASAQLNDAYLCYANLEGAILLDTVLNGASFEGANLRHVIGLDISKLSQVATLYESDLDEGILSQVKKEFPHLLIKPEQPFFD